jgi:hypothetical protein
MPYELHEGRLSHSFGNRQENAPFRRTVASESFIAAASAMKKFRERWGILWRQRGRAEGDRYLSDNAAEDAPSRCFGVRWPQ